MIVNGMYSNMLNSIFEGIYFVDKDRKITFWNKGAEDITGFKAEEMINSHCYDNKLNHVDDFGNRLCLGDCPLHQTLEDGENKTFHLYVHHKDGNRVPVQIRTTAIVEEGEVVGAVEIFTRESDTFYNRFELDDLRELALRDQQTSLPNRKSIELRLSSEIALWRSIPESFAVAFIDVDNLKAVNSSFGYPAGDEIIKIISRTLSSNVMKTDYVGRWTGEEFIAIFTDTDSDTVKIICERLRMLVEHSVLRTAEGDIKVTISIGVTFFKKNDSVQALIERAMALKNQSRRSGGNIVTMG